MASQVIEIDPRELHGPPSRLSGADPYKLQRQSARFGLGLLPRLSELTPEVRFGPLIADLSYLSVGPTPEAIWDMEDEPLLEAMQQHIAVPTERLAELR
jgi:hypothetical protein